MDPHTRSSDTTRENDGQPSGAQTATPATEVHFSIQDVMNLMGTVMQSVNQMQQTIQQQMAAAANNHHNGQSAAQAPTAGNDRILERFLKLRTPSFRGLGPNPLAPTEWVDHMEKAFRAMKCTDDQKVTCATYTLEGEAHGWWESTRSIMDGKDPVITWERFKKAFFDNFFPKSFQQKKQVEFMSLQQNSKSVQEYQQKFEELFHFAPKYITEDSAKAQQFEMGLRPQIGQVLVTHQLQNYGDVVQMAKMVEDKQRAQYQAQSRETGKRPFNGQGNGGTSKVPRWQNESPSQAQKGPGQRQPFDITGPYHCRQCGKTHSGRCEAYVCYNCRQPGHTVRTCPNPEAPRTFPVQPLQTMRLAGQQNPGGQPTRVAGKPTQPNQNARPQGRVYAITAEDAEAATEVVTGTSKLVPQM